METVILSLDKNMQIKSDKIFFVLFEKIDVL